MQILQELSHKAFVTLSHDLNCPVRSVRHPPHQLQPLGLMQCRLAKKHALNQADDRSFHANRHA